MLRGSDALKSLFLSVSAIVCLILGDMQLALFDSTSLHRT